MITRRGFTKLLGLLPFIGVPIPDKPPVEVAKEGGFEFGSCKCENPMIQDLLAPARGDTEGEVMWRCTCGGWGVLNDTRLIKYDYSREHDCSRHAYFEPLHEEDGFKGSLIGWDGDTEVFLSAGEGLYNGDVIKSVGAKMYRTGEVRKVPPNMDGAWRGDTFFNFYRPYRGRLV